tara:strand:- start:1204 stop:1434 length:231 start_codon:yes stop_codon:yes gene_type:complete
MSKKDMNSWITIEVSIKFKDYLLENNTEQMNEFLENTKTSIGESLGINIDNVKINMVKQEQPLWLDDIDLEEKAEA